MNPGPYCIFWNLLQFQRLECCQTPLNANMRLLWLNHLFCLPWPWLVTCTFDTPVLDNHLVSGHEFSPALAALCGAGPAHSQFQGPGRFLCNAATPNSLDQVHQRSGVKRPFCHQMPWTSHLLSRPAWPVSSQQHVPRHVHLDPNMQHKGPKPLEGALSKSSDFASF